MISPLLRRTVLAAILGMAAITMWAISTNRISYVVTSGISMNPVYYADDLVFVVKDENYDLGQIAAYHGPGGVKVLHRIIGGDAEHGFTFKGDNNQSIDIDKPTAGQLIGRAVLHVPKGGAWLQPVLSPTSLGMMGFLFVSSGVAVAKNRREIPRGRRKKRAKGMSGGGGSWATAAAVFKAVSRLHPALRVLAAVTALCAVAGLALGVLGWMKPLTEPKSGKGEESMTFSYSAEVPPSAAYDGTVAYSPDPIFRKLANLIDLHLTYQGKPGQIEINARLSAENGWHKTVELSRQKQFTTDRYTGTVQLDLNALEQHTMAAGKAIGAQMTATTVTVKALIRHADGSAFEPQVSLTMAQLTLTLAGGTETLVVNQSGTKPGTAVQERQIAAFGYEFFTAAKSRTYAVFLILTALFGALIVAMMALRHVPLKNRAQIQRRYPHLIVPVEPMASPPGKPVVMVDTFPALVKLAEKYGQMILTWTRTDGADDFVVRDEGVLYRYRIGPNPANATSVKADKRPVPSSGGVASETTAVPALQLPPVPESLSAGQAALTGGEEPTATEEAPVKKAAPRKRTPRTAATKAATAKATAAKTTATKTTATKRARGPAKATSPKPETATGEPAELVVTPVSGKHSVAADAEVPAPATVDSMNPDSGPAVVPDPTHGTPSQEPAIEQGSASARGLVTKQGPAAEITPAKDVLVAAGQSVTIQSSDTETPPASQSDSVRFEQDSNESGTRPETHLPELAAVTAEAETPTAAQTAPAEPGIATAQAQPDVEPTQAELELDPETTAPEPAEAGPETDSQIAQVETSGSEKATPSTSGSGTATPSTSGSGTATPSTSGSGTATPSRSQRRADRRKARSQQVPQPAVDDQVPGPDQEPLPVEEAREAMEDLAHRNLPIAYPEPASESNPEAIYDFLPVAKRTSHTPETDEPDDA